MSVLKDKKIIVTGGSRGIGAGIVKQLAQKGAHVAFSYSSNKEAAQKVLSELPGKCHFVFPLNIHEEESVQTELNQAIEQLGGIDGLVNNAGITKDQLILRMKAEDFDEVYKVNLRGTFLCTKVALKKMIKQKIPASFVHITSVVGHSGNPGQCNYTASKGGVESFSKSIALEVATREIRSNCVAPGFIATNMTDELTENQRKVIEDKIPMGTIGTVEDVASAVSFLLSDEAKYITGQTIHVNGGLYV